MIETKIKEEGKTIHHREYEDWYELMTCALDESRQVTMGGFVEGEVHYNCSSRTAEASDSWCLGVSFEDARQMVTTDGWPSGLDRVRKLAKELSGGVCSQIIRQDVRFEVQGAAVDIGCYMSGEPECFINFEEAARSGDGKIVTIGCICSFNASVPAHVFVLRGAAVMALIDLLESCGYRVEVMLSMATYKNTQVIQEMVTLKRATESVDAGRMAFALCHPAMYRRLGFSLYEQRDQKTRDRFNIYRGGGYSMSTETESAKQRADIWAGTMLQPNTDQQAIDWIKSMLVAQGVVLEGE